MGESGRRRLNLQEFRDILRIQKKGYHISSAIKHHNPDVGSRRAVPRLGEARLAPTIDIINRPRNTNRKMKSIQRFRYHTLWQGRDGWRFKYHPQPRQHRAPTNLSKSWLEWFPITDGTDNSQLAVSACRYRILRNSYLYSPQSSPLNQVFHSHRL